MDNKQSSVVPFRVRSVQTGTDITENIKLTSVESKGTSVPFFKANGNDTFTVINADQNEDKLIDTVFKFDVTDLNETYSLQAESKVNVKAYPAGTFEVTMLTNNGRAITGFVGVEKYFDVVASYQGVQLGADDFEMNPKAPDGGNPFNGAATLVRQEALADGKTRRIYFKGSTKYIVRSVQILFNRKAAENQNLKGDGYVIITPAIAITDTSQRLVMFFPSTLDARVTGNVTFRTRIYPIVTWNGDVIPLNTTGLKITPKNSTTNPSNIQDGANRFSVTGWSEEYITCTITNDNSPGANRSNQFVWEISYNGVTVDTSLIYATYAEPKSGTDSPVVSLAPINELKPNLDQKFFFTTNPISTAKWPWIYFTSYGGKFISGSGVLRSKANNAPLDTIDLTGLTADEINRYIASVRTYGSAQTLTLIGQIECPRLEEGKPIYGSIPLNTEQFVVEIPEGAYDSYAMPFEKLNNKGDNYIVIGIKEQGADGFSGNTISNFKATGPLTSTSSPSKNIDGSFVINAITNGNNGEILVTADIVGPPPESRAYKYNKKLLVSGSDLVVITPKTVDVKVWDQLDTVPFSVVLAGQDVTSEIRNVKLIANEYIITDPSDPTKWIVNTAPTAGASKSTFFTFEVNVGGNWKPKVTYGVYRIAAWNGISMTASIPDNMVIAGVGKEEYFDVEVKYQGKPAADKVEVADLGARSNLFKIVSQEPIENNTKLRVTVTGVYVADNAGNGMAGFNNTPPTSNFKFKLKGTGGDTNLNSVTVSGVKCFVPRDGLILYGYGGSIKGEAGKVFAPAAADGSGRTAETYIFLNGERIPLESPRLEIYHSPGQNIGSPNSGTVACEFVGGSGTTVYMRITRGYPAVNGGYFNPTRFKVKNDDGTEVIWSPIDNNGNFWVHPTNTTMASDVIIVPAAEVKPGARNKLKLTFTSGGTLVGYPNILSRILFPWPEDSNAIDLSQEYSLAKDPNDTNAYILDFMAGVAGGRIILRGGMTGNNISGINYLNGSIEVPKPTFTVELIDNEFNGVTNAETTIKFKVTKVGEPVIGATITNNSVGTGGSVRSGKDFKEIGDGVYSIVVVGAGAEGEGFATFELDDGDLKDKVVLEPLHAVIDSSNFKLILEKTEISGKKGDRITVNAQLTDGETNYNLDDFGTTWSTDPADVISIPLRTKTALTFEILQEVPYDKVISVNVKAGARGMTTESPMEVTLVGALVVTTLDPKVSVWDKSDTPPLKFMMGTRDVTSTINSISFTETDVVKHNGLKGGYQIISDKAIPLTKQNVEYTYKYAADSEEVKVSIPFTINAYDGVELVFTPTFSSSYLGPNGELLIEATSRVSVSFTAKYRGVLVNGLEWVNQPIGNGYASKVDSPAPDIIPNGIRVYYQTKDIGCVMEEIGSNLKVRGSAGDQAGINTGLAKFNLSLFKATTPFYLSTPKPGIVSGKLGDEMTVTLLGYFEKTQIPLDNANISFGKPTKDGIEIVPGSMTKDTFKVRFTKDVVAETANVLFDVTLTYKDPKGTNNAATLSMYYHQYPLYQPLALADGFVTTVEGDTEEPVTVKQAVKIPE